MTEINQTNEAIARRWLLIAASTGVTFSILHHIDHIIRGNHVGWPVTDELTPFTYSLVIYFFVFPGLWLTAKGKVGAGYWLVVAIAGILTAGPIHLGPWAVEPLGDIIQPWADPLAYCVIAPANRVDFFKNTYAPVSHPAWAILAVTIMISLLVSLVMLIITSIRTRRLVGHW